MATAATSTATLSVPFFFVFDFYHMQGAKEDNDVLPEAILYFYPTDDQSKKQRLLNCGEIVGLVQYFQHDLFLTTPQTFTFGGTLVAHEHYGRHSAFLCAPRDRSTSEEVHLHLKHIVNLFHLLYGTWNHVQATHPTITTMHSYLQQTLTPLIEYVFSRTRSITQLFSTIEYTPLKKGNQRVLLESKHYLDFLKCTYGLEDALIGCDEKVLYTTLNSETTFNLQQLFEMRKQLPEELIFVPRESEKKLHKGVSLFRIYLPHASASVAPVPVVAPPVTPIARTSAPINIFDGFLSQSDDNMSNRNSLVSASSPTSHNKRFGQFFSVDQSGSSEDTGMETDTTEDIPAINIPIDLLLEENNEPTAPSTQQHSLTDDQKAERSKNRSRSSTMSDEKDDMEKTIELHRSESNDEPNRIHFTPIHITASDDEFDEYVEIGSPIFRASLADSFYQRHSTITSESDLFSNDRPEARISWTDIPDTNKEQERKGFVLYLQRNSRMIVAGVIDELLLNDEFLKKLWSSLLSQMANMETDIQAISAAKEITASRSDIRFQFNGTSRQAQFERVIDSNRLFYKMPSEESSTMAWMAQSKLNRHVERRMIGLSRGNNIVSVDRRVPDRATYLCRRYQEN